MLLARVLALWGKGGCGGSPNEVAGKMYQHHLTALYVQSGQLRVWGGRRVVVCVMANRIPRSKRRKKKAFATRH